MAAGIYRLFCVVSGKSYVGQSKNVVNRVETHFRRLHENRHYNQHLQRSFNFHGHDAFLAEVLEYCDQEVLTEREQHWMDFYGFENLYNVAPAAGSTAGIKLSEETRQRLSEVNKGKKRSDETRQRMSENHVGMKGRKLSEEHRKKLSEAQKGRKDIKGKALSEEHRRRIGEAQKARWARYRAEKEATQ